MPSETQAAPAAGPTIPVEHMPEIMKPRATEMNTYMREAPRLLREGNEGRYALIHRDQFLGVWNTYSDVLEAGYGRFGPDRDFMAQKISARDYEHFLTLVDKPYGAPA